MTIHARIRVLDLLNEHPDLDEVFENYGIEVTDTLMGMTLKQVCQDEGVNYWELKSDLIDAIGWDGSADYGSDEEEEEEEEEDVGWVDDDDDDGDDSDDGDEDDDDDDVVDDPDDVDVDDLDDPELPDDDDDD